jgi:Uma2 family endonuclease
MATKINTARVMTSAPMTPAPPPLESGDHLRRAEFERRYEAMPWVKKAELVEGVVFMGSPVRQKSHSKPHGFIITWLGIYCSATPQVDIGDNATVRLDIDNEPQPDALLRIEPEAGGHSRVSDDDYIEGPPELVAEIAASSASYDLHDKLHAYRRNGVQEYLVWRIYDQQIDWWELHEGEYQPLTPDQNGIIHSRVFPSLCLNVSALLTGDLAGVLATQQRILNNEEHAAFVARLARKDAGDHKL